MRKETISISERDFMYCLAGQLYEQAPNRMPRKANDILMKALEAFRSDESCSTNISHRTIHVESDKLYQWINDLLYNIPEFKELNLSLVEYEKNIDVDDPSRTGYRVTSIYDVEKEDDWKTDFIDLDAFIQNVYCAILDKKESSGDCFLCTYQDPENESTLSCGKSEKCKTCSINPEFKNNYESSRYPKGKYTIACKYDCIENYYICCKECRKRASCSHECEADPDTCGLVYTRREHGDEEE